MKFWRWLTNKCYNCGEHKQSRTIPYPKFCIGCKKKAMHAFRYGMSKERFTKLFAK